MVNIFRIIYIYIERESREIQVAMLALQTIRIFESICYTMLGFEQLSSKLILKALLSSTELNI